MTKLARIGVAIDSVLLEKFDRLIEANGYANRSEAFRDLIRDRLIRENTGAPGAQVAGTLTLIYDHHHNQLSDKLTAIQHQFHQMIVSALHVHLDHDNCLEVLVLRGRSADVRQVADRLIATKGIKHGQLVITTADVTALEHPHSH